MIKIFSPLESFEPIIHTFVFSPKHLIILTSPDIVLIAIILITFSLIFNNVINKIKLFDNDDDIDVERNYFASLLWFSDEFDKQIDTKGRHYYFLVILTGIIILLLNEIGSTSGGFLVTSFITSTLTFSITINCIVVLEGVRSHGLSFFKRFVPKNLAVGLTQLVTLIEVFSYILRVFSLAIRLTANRRAGHILLSICLGAFASVATNEVSFLAFAILATLVTLLILLESAVAIIQSYVFALLTSIYLNEAIALH